MNAQTDPTPPDAWLDDHAEELVRLAQDSGLTLGRVQLAAILVLAGMSDPEIYNELGIQRLSSNGQHDPLAGAPSAIEELRRMTSSGENEEG